MGSKPRRPSAGGTSPEPPEPPPGDGPQTPEPPRGGRARSTRASAGLPDPHSWPARPPCHLREDQMPRRHLPGAWPGDPQVGKFCLCPVHPALLPHPEPTPPPTEPPCQSYRQHRPTLDHGAGREAGLAPCPHLGAPSTGVCLASGWPPGASAWRAGELGVERRAGPAHGTSKEPS